MRSMTLVLLAGLVAGCENDFYISGDGVAAAFENPPSLATPIKEEIITQVTTPEVDILWIIDDSGSMAEEQQKLRDNFPEFMRFFLDSGLDYHIGVVSTDTDNNKAGKLRGAGGYTYIDPNTPNPIALFSDMASLGTLGSFDEKARKAAYMALTDPLVDGFNAGFYRDVASLHMIVISDENDYSGNDPTRNEFVSWAEALKPDADRVTFSAIVGPAGGCATAEAGSDYLFAVDSIGGISESICRSDWAPVLEALGMQAAGLKREYFLSEVPVPGTIKVWVIEGDRRFDGIDEADLVGGVDPGDLCEATSCFVYGYDEFRNSVIMRDYVPSPLADVHVSYELLEAFQPGASEGDL